MANENFPRPPAQRALDLPIYRFEQELVEAIRHHQVVVVAGPTGCGKTTQLPQMLLRAGLTDRCIGVTQPRRLAAVSVAWRIAEEQGVTCGREVGYAIRFDDCSGNDTRIRLMTDGILLQEAHWDANWERYGVLVIDEAHERSLNIDFALGLLHDALKSRPDLRVVVSSATIDPKRFVSFFQDIAPVVPVVSIDARPYPVDLVWKPLIDGRPETLTDAIVDEVLAIQKRHMPGHVLVFLPGEESIKQAAIALRVRSVERDAVVLPLYGAMQREDQEKVFSEFGGRKLILATNIAETSITVDDVRHVIDSGLAKVPRVSVRTGVTQLREEGISRASADQRLGRAGRTAPGRCVRLYNEREYMARPPFTDEEILRLDLTETVLRLLDLGVRDVESFAFPTPPVRTRLMAALDSLLQLGAIDTNRVMTPIGKQMVPYPLSPPLARMVIEALDHHPDIADDVLLLAAWWSSRPPTLYPAGQEDLARKAHGRFADPLGDAHTALKMARGWQQAADKNAYCQKNFLDPSTIAFNFSAHRQLRQIAEKRGTEIASGGDLLNIARCVAAGFAQNVLASHGRFYEGPSEDKVLIHPASSLYGMSPRFAVATEIVISQRCYARQVVALKSAWVAEFRPDLADRWKLQTDHLKRGEGVKPVKIDVLHLGQVMVAVDSGKGRPRVELDRDQVMALLAQGPIEVPEEMGRWQGRIRWNDRYFAQGTPLTALLALLPLLPLPKDGADLNCAVPEGALLEPMRNRHTLLRHLPVLLQPMMPHAGKKPGWAGLICNGDDGYWYEVMADYREAVETSAASVELLLQAYDGDTEAEEQVQAVLTRLQDQVERVRAALERSREKRAQRRP
jgi:HrpA-like RNA helicase